MKVLILAQSRGVDSFPKELQSLAEELDALGNQTMLYDCCTCNVLGMYWPYGSTRYLTLSGYLFGECLPATVVLLRLVDLLELTLGLKRDDSKFDVCVDVNLQRALKVIRGLTEAPFVFVGRIPEDRQAFEEAYPQTYQYLRTQSLAGFFSTLDAEFIQQQLEQYRECVSRQTSASWSVAIDSAGCTPRWP